MGILLNVQLFVNIAHNTPGARGNRTRYTDATRPSPFCDDHRPSMLFVPIVRTFIALLLIVAGVIIAQQIRQKLQKKSARQQWILPTALVLTAAVLSALTLPYPLHFAMPPTMQSHAPGGMPPSIPFLTAWQAIWDLDRFARVDEAVGADPALVPPRTEPDSDGIVRITLTAQEVIGEVAPGVYYNYWTYNGTTPGPMLRVREGDVVDLTLTNDPTSLHPHNIDLHSVNGPGGGAELTNVAPGETKSFRWTAKAAGIYEYHCAMANVSVHNAHGQYGLILVEPQEGMTAVDKEFYLMQGELYMQDALGAKGLQMFSAAGVLEGKPTYITFNGIVERTPRMEVAVGERVRLYVGNGGVNLVSSFHVIGEIFDNVYIEGALSSPPLHNIQTTVIPAGGATIVEFVVDEPGTYILVDHALARMNRGAWASLVARE